MLHKSWQRFVDSVCPTVEIEAKVAFYDGAASVLETLKDGAESGTLVDSFEQLAVELQTGMTEIQQDIAESRS